MPEGGWGSHQPALAAIAKFTKIRSVIEFGAGKNSTLLFLDRKAYPHLTSLVTFEHKNEWAESVRMEDDRHTLIIKPSDEFAALSKNMKADFVFLDSGPSFDARFSLLREVLTLAPILGIHDCTEADVRGRGVNLKYMKEFNSDIQVVFMSDTADLSGLELIDET